MKKRVFIVGAYLAYGGTYMVYHLGRILEKCFGMEAIAVSQVGETAAAAQQASIFPYDLAMPSIPLAELALHATPDDILVSCDIGAKYMIGWNFPGKKISYVQTLQPTDTIDMGYQHYISVSDIVSRYFNAVYGIPTKVIPPFINREHFPAVPPWIERPQNVVLPYRKGTRGNTVVWDKSLELLQAYVAQRNPDIVFAAPLFNGALQSQGEILKRIGQARYLLVLTEMEGFGLIPLEAMALGTIPVGFDGFGGTHYMRQGVNCGTVGYAQIAQAGDAILGLVQDAQSGQKMSERGKLTADLYDYSAFEAAWVHEFSQILEMAPLARISAPFLAP